MREMVTVGVYGFTAESFVQRLHQANVRLLLDVRQRRGVRGPAYAWANSLRLQEILAQAQIAYEHHPELAPTTELRHLQYAEDDRQGVGKRSRHELAPAYIRRYTTEILDHADLDQILRGTGTAALLCVERDPEACHRSLIAERLTSQHGTNPQNGQGFCGEEAAGSVQTLCRHDEGRTGSRCGLRRSP
ncbi:DUF488 domain-containing protein [Lentzea alba]|uniref:DUF488 family protein, N3 subclade n=1 Tax=Lentzea alba TaxID=2714351 RepID=UPI0039BF692F